MTTSVQPVDSAYLERVRANFATQAVMTLFGASLTHLGPGKATISWPYDSKLTQQDGFVHAGVLSTVADSAGGYAGFTLFPKGSRVLTTEYKMHFLAPAKGERFEATGTVIKSGRTLTICELRVEAIAGGERTLCAYGTQTLICIPAPA